MKIVHFGACLGTGKGEFFVDLALEMSRLAEVHLIVPAEAKYVERVAESDVNLHLYHARNTRWNPALLWEIARLIRKIEPDIVHAHFAKATEIYKTINHWLRKPFVATKHNPRRGRVYETLPHVIAVSKQVAESVASGRTRIIYNGVREIPGVQPSRGPGDKFRIVAVGRLDPIKGFDRLIAEMAETPEHVELEIFGDGPQRPLLVEQIEKLGLNHRVFLRGFVQDIPQRLANAHLAVVSSIKEGGPVAAIEALFYCPLLISTPVGIVPEFLPKSFLCKHGEFAQKIRWVEQNYSSLKAQFENIRAAWKPRLRLDSVVREHLAYYREILDAERKQIDG